MSGWADATEAAHIINGGGVVAYPTEAVFGLGCDPFNEAAVTRLLKIKGRPANKGLIVIGANFEQIRPFVNVTQLASEALGRIQSSWPGPVTWIMPTTPAVPSWLTGEHQSIAVRVTAHELAASLCLTCDKALVSTSANLSNEPPARTAAEVKSCFGNGLDAIMGGQVGGRASPSSIFDAHSGAQLR